MKALIIEDDKVTRLMFKKLLADFHMDIVEAKDGVDGLMKVEDEGPFDIIFIDWGMPNMNGVEFIEHIKRRADSSSTKLIMVTGNEALDENMMAQSLGIDAYIVKPLELEKITNTINSLMK
jgi:two-component system, chemotaxis family, chemotaxis protein CheY